ncbi:uncharacterized protein LOC109828258 [Asparagus officinalis]|uniref:uncharacterized protein LOC109828258 n=1 Tax=Asparagus officinalis TaxID=4686 RepID=UPI00098E5EA1|nr:uncharacterized protein LOC109828258 [Asparagus officinalis]
MEEDQNLPILYFHHEDFDDNLFIRIIELAAEAADLITKVSGCLSQEFIANTLNFRSPRRGITDLGLTYLQSKMDNHPQDFRRIYRMYPDCFMKLCNILRERGHIQDTYHISVEEMIAIFLLTVSQNQRYSVSTDRFDRSKWTISVCFNKALHALVSLASFLMASPPTDPPDKVKSESRFWPYFKDCIGAIDGTHIPCMVYNIDQTPYRNRHGFLSQNVLAACTFDLKFIYVLAGWEGSANDARVLKDAMSRPYGLPLPQNKFYLVDCGYPNRLQFLAPYRGQRYHLSEFGPANNRQRPRNSKEVFNHRHASLRNCVERIFGVFKSRFTIFKSQPPGFPYATQIKMFVACVGLHNFLRLENTNDDFDIYDLPLEAPRNVADADDDSDEEDELQTQQTQRAAAGAWRNSMLLLD